MIWLAPFSIWKSVTSHPSPALPCTTPEADCGSTAVLMRMTPTVVQRRQVPREPKLSVWVSLSSVGPIRAARATLLRTPYLLAWDYGLNHSEAVTIDLPSDNEGPIAPCVSPTGGHWAHDSTGWWYACASGTDYLKGGWFTINGSDYQFGPSGYMMTGFLKRADGTWVYADSEGALVGGWVRDGGSWYYLDPATKTMATGWFFDRGSWYYLGDSGDMHTGWCRSAARGTT